eukprot:310874-Amphidinium_carterae.1
MSVGHAPMSHEVSPSWVCDSTPCSSGSTKWCLEVFAGSANLTRAWRAAGLPTLLAVDVVVNDLVVTSTDVGLDFVGFVHFGTPCSTFSRARKYDGGPRPLRSSDCIEGLAGLPYCIVGASCP